MSMLVSCWNSQAIHKILCLVVVCTICSSVEAAGDSPLITSGKLAKALDSDVSTVVVDVRSKEDFATSHLPGSRWIEVSGWKAESLKPMGLKNEKYWSAQISELGISKDDVVVVVGDSLPNTSRAWWLLRYLGVSDTRVLHGGIDAWKAQKQQLTNEIVRGARTEFKAEFQQDLLAELRDVRPGDSRIECKIIDARSDAEYQGSKAARTGHIPGAVNLEWSQFLGADGTLMSPDEVKRVLRKSGVSLDSVFVAHCQTGARSSVVVLALEIAGVKDVKNYYRGWGEYSADKKAPIE